MDNVKGMCVLRTQSLCDGDRVINYRRAVGPTRVCYCVHIAAQLVDGEAEAVAELRTDRARTVARSDELQRLTERSWRLTSAPTGRPPF